MTLDGHAVAPVARLFARFLFCGFVRRQLLRPQGAAGRRHRARARERRGGLARRGGDRRSAWPSVAPARRGPAGGLSDPRGHALILRSWWVAVLGAWCCKSSRLVSLSRFKFHTSTHAGAADNCRCFLSTCLWLANSNNHADPTSSRLHDRMDTVPELPRGGPYAVGVCVWGVRRHQ